MRMPENLEKVRLDQMAKAMPDEQNHDKFSVFGIQMASHPGATSNETAAMAIKSQSLR